MEGRSHFSEKRHNDFLTRFKGKISVIDKTGHLGVAASSGKPIQKIVSPYNAYPPSPYINLDVSSLSTALPSSRMSVCGCITTLNTHNKYYTPAEKTTGYFKDRIDDFSKACNFYKKGKTFDSQAINPLHLQENSWHDSISRKNMQRAGAMSLKETPRYPSQGRSYKIEPQIIPTSKIEAINKNQYSAHVVQKYSYANNEALVNHSLPSKYKYYNYRRSGTHILTKPDFPEDVVIQQCHK